LPDGSLSTLLAKTNTKFDGSLKENARLRELGLASIKNPGDNPDLTTEVSEQDALFLQEIYANKIRDADQRLGNFLSSLKNMGLLDRSIVAIISDHGDEFMEHGALDHGATLYQEQLHTVMMIRFPGYARQHDVHTPVRSMDLFPTIFDILGFEGLHGTAARSLLPLLRGQKLDLPIFAETDYRLFTHLRMLRKGPHKLILDLQNGEKELYNLEKDPQEKNNISSEEPRITYELEQAIRSWMDEIQTNPEDYLGVRQKPITIF